MLCPHCGSGNTRISMTSITPESTVTRVRSCQGCGKHWTTIEFPVPSKLTEFSFKATEKKPMLIRQFAWWIQEQVRRFDEGAA